MLEKQDTTISILRDVKKDTEGIKEGIECIKKNTESIGEKQDTTIGILRDIKQDTKYIPSVISEINDLKVKYGLMETNINRIKEVLNVPVSV
ncbi:MAG: hypothetical protein BWK75_04015 [Candidatus Altiarchaeales archaeon A3]|nr:MAG: hypothetical protein BWK75_04015 [Candidatus Altiarchaeales archaeon A3]